MRTICIYHSRDLDGWMSAAIVKKWFTQNNNVILTTYPPKTQEIDFLGWDYGNTIPNLDEYDKIIMCDVSFPPNIMFELHETCNFIWIDHHISAIKALQHQVEEEEILDIGYPEGIRDTKFAACELTWEYFFPNEEMPEIVRLLGMYDCFRHKGTNEERKVLEFQYGARESITDYNEAFDSLCADIDHNITEDIMLQGRIIYNYLCIEARQTYSKSFLIELFELNKYIPHSSNYRKFLAVNQERFNPINFGIDYHKDGYGGFACFWYNNGKWNFSLYNDDGKVDCSVIAEQYGGGGHKGASGFIIDDINKIIK